MSFLFNFPNPNENFETEETLHSEQLNLETKEVNSEMNIRKINPLCLDVDYLNVVRGKYKVVVIGEHIIKYIPSSAVFEAKKNLNSYMPHISEESHSDLLPGVYEGGLKLWECSLDLAKYLCNHKCLKSGIKILELGCGPGIPGILAYLEGAIVTFQDYNYEVLELVTIPNIIINTTDEKQLNISKLCNFISGDWSKIKNEYSKSLEDENEKFDVILTSETIYAKQNHWKLLDLMQCSLKSNGTIYLAAKTYYFGVGGTLDNFQELLQKHNIFTWQLCYSSNDGVERQIMKINFKNM